MFFVVSNLQFANNVNFTHSISPWGHPLNEIRWSSRVLSSLDSEMSEASRIIILLLEASDYT